MLFCVLLEYIHLIVAGAILGMLPFMCVVVAVIMLVRMACTVFVL